MNRLIACVAGVLALVTLPATAQGTRPGDDVLDAAALIDRLSGNTVEFFDGSTASYAADGSYRYLYAPGDDPFSGQWRADNADGVCVLFDNGFSRCDRYVDDGRRLVLIIGDGTRFPVREMRAN